MSGPVDPRLLRVAPATRSLLSLLTLIQLAGAGLILAQSWLIASVVVSVFTHGTAAGIAGRLVALGGVGLARSLLAAAQEAATTSASITVRSQLRRRTLDAVAALGPSWAARRESGALATATGPGLDAIDGYLTRAVPALVGSATVPVVVLVAIGWADWQSALLLVLMIPLVPLFMVLVGVTTRRRVERQQALLSRLSGQFLDLLRGLTTLTVYGAARRQEQTLRRLSEQYRKQTVSALKVAFLSALALDLVATLSVAVIAVDVGLRLRGASLGFEVALFVLLLAPELYQPLRAFGAQYHASESGAVAAATALDIVAEADGLPAAGTATAPDAAPRLRAVSVTYPGRAQAALDRVDLDLTGRQLTVLTGESGGGKTTLLAALLGYVRPDEGSVRVGDTDLGDIDPHSWRAGTAWLPQRPVPTSATVADEVRMGDPAATDEQVAAACTRCATPGPSTPLGEDGSWVSAGQRRRVALARALLRARAVAGRGRTPLLLLDEPSEDLDRDTEQVVCQVLADLAGWATVVVATHSAALMALADRRITVADGRIVADVATTPTRPAPVPVAAGEPDPPVPVPEPPVAERYSLRRLIRDHGSWRSLLSAGLLSAGAGLSGLALTGTSIWLISRAAQHPNVQALGIAVVGVRTFALTRSLLRYLERLVTHDGALSLLVGVRGEVFGALRPLTGALLSRFGRGDLLRRFVGDVDSVQDTLVRTVIPFVGAMVTALAAAGFAAILSPVAGLVLAAGLVVGGLLVPLATSRLAGDTAAAAALTGARDVAAHRTVVGLSELVGYGRAEQAVDEVEELDRRAGRATRRSRLAGTAGVFAEGAVAGLTLPAVLWAGALTVQEGDLRAVTVGVLVACVLAGFEGAAALPGAFAAWARCRSGIDRVGQLLSTPPTFAEPATPEPVPTGPLGITADHVTVHPEPSAPAVLDGATIAVAPGQRVAVVGPSGCGKSTLLAATLRLVPAASGTVCLVGADRVVSLTDLGAADVPPAVAGSLQGDYVFDASLRDNLRVVRPDATDDDLDDVARRAGLSRFLDSLPARWDTTAGADGVLVSGGQRQRLLLARALLAGPQVLVLDEPTAHLDTDTERAVLGDLFAATAGRTLIMTSHRRLPEGVLDEVYRVQEQQLVPAGATVPL